ncbi:hypothetical protein Pelo_9787 [Pelomyxa schiedti]|nr:hypothetical protein Pelo_9787 [Pelomyxa schiedti]
MSSSSAYVEVETWGGMEGITVTFAFLSLLACSFVFSSLLISGDFVIIPYFGVLCLSVSDFIQGLSVLVAQFETNNKGACEAAGSLFYYNYIVSNYRVFFFFFFTLGFLGQTSDVAGNALVLYIAITLFLHLRKQFKKSGTPDADSLTIKWYHLVAVACIWIVAIGSAIVPLTEWLGVHYGKGPIGTCWIGADPLMARFVLFYIGFWILFVITATMYTVIFSLVPVLPEGDSPGQRVQPRQFLFALSMIIIWVPCTINRVCESVGHPVRGLEYMQAIVLPLWGFVDSTIYFFSKFRLAHVSEILSIGTAEESIVTKTLARLKRFVQLFY